MGPSAHTDSREPGCPSVHTHIHSTLFPLGSEDERIAALRTVSVPTGGPLTSWGDSEHSEEGREGEKSTEAGGAGGRVREGTGGPLFLYL